MLSTCVGRGRRFFEEPASSTDTVSISGGWIALATIPLAAIGWTLSEGYSSRGGKLLLRWSRTLVCEFVGGPGGTGIIEVKGWRVGASWDWFKMGSAKVEGWCFFKGRPIGAYIYRSPEDSAHHPQGRVPRPSQATALAESTERILEIKHGPTATADIVKRDSSDKTKLTKTSNGITTC